jgi:hypothetical protein
MVASRRALARRQAAKRRMAARAQESLPPREEMVAGVAGFTGPAFWLEGFFGAALSSVAVQVSLACCSGHHIARILAIGMGLLAACLVLITVAVTARRQLFFAVTPTQFICCSRLRFLPWWLGRYRMVFSDPLPAARLTGGEPSALTWWRTVRYRGVDNHAVRLNVPLAWAKELDALRAALADQALSNAGH